MTLEDWHRVIDTNLTSTFLLAREAQRALRTAKGAIVTVASSRALMSEPNTESYAASTATRGTDACAGRQSRPRHPRQLRKPGWVATADYNKIKRRAISSIRRARRTAAGHRRIVAVFCSTARNPLRHRREFHVGWGMTRKMITVE